MFNNQKLVNRLLAKISEVEKKTLEDLISERIEQEPAVTDRLLGVMQYLLNHQTIAGVRWRAKTLTDRGRGSQENNYGADFLAALEIDLQGYQVKKGFLAQSKLIEPSENFSRANFEKMREQCEKMLKHSSASYVFLYSQQSGITIIPAIEVLGARNCNPHELTNRTMRQFYKEHFECFIGDRAIQSATPQALRELSERFDARSAILISGVDSRTELQLNLFDIE
ncbi:hypothetical protein L2E68_17130 [Planktothrix agardhii 1029]|uniref:Uncharacterized protein n=1 Tax=Planktothrix agardhii (strain NIVA-CYA 126/8) TaxID=388467 RepID=A0A073CDB1_PLAA1|nr:hypothetical protein [Planktothrix agardhii]KEI65882.1 hypothetical protein A19Y_0712 [Planktothrix agardhii NIVA-CYA 126/8]MCB8762923.1 hypothetical protein [Planktothrix agardhii 1809]MCB8776519.1 hypothetical protein [Planktothrix agardhii 1031]MCB8780942.1 hypothetical protein [Planktothrix agardhii 1808]MCF3567871.1 hypothetical protein [Planktothrix agardhii 1807]